MSHCFIVTTSQRPKVPTSQLPTSQGPNVPSSQFPIVPTPSTSIPQSLPISQHTQFHIPPTSDSADPTPIQRGIPVATVGINNSTNAALLAIRILGTSIPRLTSDVEAYAHKLENEVLGKVEVLEGEGWEKYVARLKK